MSRSVIVVTVSKRQGDLYGEKLFFLPYDYSNKDAVPIYAHMVREILQGCIPAERKYNVNVGYNYTDLSYDEYDSRYDVTFMDLSSVMRILSYLKLYAVKETVRVERVVNEYEELISVHVGHMDNVRLEYESIWNNTFMRIEVPKTHKYNSSYMRKMYRDSIAQTLFNGYEHKVSIKGDPYVHGNFRMERTNLNGSPVTAIYKKEREVDFKKVVDTETVEL